MENPLFLIIMIIGIILIFGLTAYTILVYKKLKTYGLLVNKLWLELKIIVDKNFRYIDSVYDSIKVETTKELRDLIDKYYCLTSIEEIMMAYIELERFVDAFKDKKVKSVFLKENKKLMKIKTLYNNTVLKYNNVINLMTNKFIARAFGFHEGMYFINKK